MIRVYVGSVDLTGVNSTFAMVAAEILGVSPDQVEVVQGDTRSGPFAGPSGGSQITYSVAAAVANAAQAVKQQLLELAEDHFEARIDDLEIKDGNVRVRGVPDRTISIGSLAAIAETKRGGSGPVIGEGRAAIPDSAPGFAVHLAQVRVDPETGQTSLLRYVAIHDIGFALNPLLVEGQIHGGAAQGIGWALHEAMRYDEHGELLTGSLMDYDLPHIDTVPSIEVILVDNPSPSGPFGARGIGEPPIIPGGAVIANAIRAATGVRVTELPIRDETLWQAMQRS
jgi:CO/xanthine dehydrogenase Mo-binding subunit